MPPCVIIIASLSRMKRIWITKNYNYGQETASRCGIKTVWIKAYFQFLLKIDVWTKKVSDSLFKSQNAIDNLIIEPFFEIYPVFI